MTDASKKKFMNAIFGELSTSAADDIEQFSSTMISVLLMMRRRWRRFYVDDDDNGEDYFFTRWGGHPDRFFYRRSSSGGHLQVVICRVFITFMMMMMMIWIIITIIISIAINDLTIIMTNCSQWRQRRHWQQVGGAANARTWWKGKKCKLQKKVTLTLSKLKEILNIFDDPFQSSTLLCYTSLYTR